MFLYTIQKLYTSFMIAPETSDSPGLNHYYTIYNHTQIQRVSEITLNNTLLDFLPSLVIVFVILVFGSDFLIFATAP